MTTAMPGPEDPTVRWPPPTAAETATLRSASPDAAPAAMDDEWLSGTVIGEGQYQIQRELARGGMGVVHLAVEVATQRLVVIKSLLSRAAGMEEYKRRFLREASAWVELGAHPCIVRAHTAMEIDFLPRIVAEYVPGGTLNDWLKSPGRPLSRRLRIAAQIAWGMDYAHRVKDLAHRDLKPANILLDADENARITDFGLATHTDEHPAAGARPVEGLPAMYGTLITQGVIGTPEYIAPEQWEGHGGKAADIYAFGVILYELFCGCRPFDYSGMDILTRITAYQRSHLQDAPPTPRELNAALASELPAELQSLMADCLAKKPGDRPHDFREVAGRLNAIARSLSRAPAAEEPTPMEMDYRSQQDQAYGMLRLARSSLLQSNYAESERFANQALTLFDGIGFMPGLFRSYHTLAVIKLWAGDLTPVSALLETWERRLRQFDGEEWRAGIASIRGMLAAARFDTDKALEWYMRAVEHHARTEHPDKGYMRNNIAKELLRQGRHDEALSHLHVSLESRVQTGNIAEEGTIRINIGVILGELGRHAEAEANFQQAIELSRRTRRWAIMAVALHDYGHLDMQLGRMGPAIQRMKEALELYKTYGTAFDIAQIMSSMCQCHVRAGRLEEGRACLEKAGPLDEDTPHAIPGLRAAAELHAAEGRRGDAIAALNRALALARRFHHASRELEALLATLQGKQYGA